VQKQDISAVQTSSMKDNEGKTVQKQDEEEVQKPVQKASSEEEKKPVQKAEKEEEKPIQKAEKKEEDKPVQKAEKKEEDKPIQKEEANEKKEVQTKHEEDKKDEHPPIMHKKKEGSRTDKSSDIAERIKNTKGNGRPLSERTSRQMEQAFGADFSKVIIHTDGESDSLNKDLHSLAFTNGNDIYFAEGQYNPDSSSGKTLLAHELTHVIQQTGK
jgi:outer membrane biosynthesis protein TonB